LICGTFQAGTVAGCHIVFRDGAPTGDRVNETSRAHVVKRTASGHGNNDSHAIQTIIRKYVYIHAQSRPPMIRPYTMHQTLYPVKTKTKFHLDLIIHVCLIYAIRQDQSIKQSGIFKVA